MSMTGDFFLGGHVSLDDLRMSLARAIGIPFADVDVLDLTKPREGTTTGQIQLIPITMNAAGNYPGQYIVAADDWIVERFDTIAGQLAQHLRVPVLSAGDRDDPDIMLLSLPDGATFHVLAEQDDEDHGMHNTPEMQRLIDAHPAPTRVRAA
ncbi:MAG: hypothetical protein ACTHQE_15385 [Thermomicrobiales bacterium]